MLFKNFSERDARAAGKFLVGLAFAAAAFHGLFSLVPLAAIELLVARVSLALLGFIGLPGEIVSFDEPVQMTVAGEQIIISYLCTGLLELSLIVAAVVASFGIAWEKRVKGVLGATAVGFAFNQARIVSTVWAIAAFGYGTGELAHDVLFRISLFAVIAGYYFAWFRWATKKA